MGYRLYTPVVAAMLFLVLTGCGGLQEQVSLNPEPGKKVVEMKAENFSFHPNNLKIHSGDILIFRIENTSNIDHNFTLKNPGGEVLQDVFLPAGEVTEVEAEFKNTGTYGFFCDKPFHPALGMEGRIMAAEM